MPGSCSIFRSWNTGDTLTASDLTSSFTTVGVTNMTPQCLDDYSTNEAQMQSTTDPYPSSAVSLATSTAGELERIRYVIKQITGQAQWYIDPTSSLSNLGLRVFLSPEGATFPTTNFPQLVKNSGTNWVHYTLDFDQTTSEACYYRVSVPNGVTVTSANIEIFSTQAAATSGTVGWTVTTLTRADGEAWDTAGNADTVTADAVEGTAGFVHKQTKALTVTGWAADEVLLVKIARDVADTVAEDVKFMGALLRIA